MKIVILDNLLTPQECMECIEHSNKYAFHTEFHGRLIRYLNDDISPIKEVLTKIKDASQENFSSPIKIGWGEMVLWPKGTCATPHKDFSDENTVLTSVTYLNDDYEGGQTYFVDDIAVIPKVGRTIIFDGQYYEHGVSEVTNGVRYSLPIWYENNC